jgi:hypothetical protein
MSLPLKDAPLDLRDVDVDINMEEVDQDLAQFQKDGIVKEALEKGVDLRSYSQQIEADLAAAEAECIDTYIGECNDIAVLHGEIRTCDGILERMQDMLSTFQADLGSISSDIKRLQDQSTSMSVKLRNRSAAETRLSKFIQRVMVPSELVGRVCEGPIDDDYMCDLKVLSRKISFLDSRNAKRKAEFFQTKAGRDTIPVLAQCRLKAVARLREFLCMRIRALKKPNTNVQIKQNLLMKYKVGPITLAQSLSFFIPSSVPYRTRCVQFNHALVFCQSHTLIFSSFPTVQDASN